MLDKSHKVCYNIIVPRGTKKIFKAERQKEVSYGKRKNDTGTET